MIRNFKHKGLERFYKTGNVKGINSAHAKRIKVRLTYLNIARTLEELPPQWKCHPLYEDLEGCQAIWATPQWRIVFRFEEGEFCDVDYMQYHG